MSDEIETVLAEAIVMPPVTAVAVQVVTGLNPGLAHDEIVTTMEFVVLTPGTLGDQLAIFTLILDPALAEEHGFEDTPQDSEESHQ